MKVVISGTENITEYTYNWYELRVKKVVKNSKITMHLKKQTFFTQRAVILEADAADNVKIHYIKGINYIARFHN